MDQRVEVPEDGWHCPLCNAGLWINHNGTQYYLMRLGEVALDDCILCLRMTVEVSE